MIDLEEEFRELINKIYTEIHTKQVAGEISAQEAEQLTRMVNDRVSFPDNDDSWCSSHGAWQSSDCFGN